MKVITVTVDHNNDRLEIENSDGSETITFDIKRMTITMWVGILYEIFNMISPEDEMLVLKEINEDSVRTVGEW